MGHAIPSPSTRFFIYRDELTANPLWSCFAGNLPANARRNVVPAQQPPHLLILRHRRHIPSIGARSQFASLQSVVRTSWNCSYRLAPHFVVLLLLYRMCVGALDSSELDRLTRFSKGWAIYKREFIKEFSPYVQLHALSSTD